MAMLGMSQRFCGAGPSGRGEEQKRNLEENIGLG
jgi:hypothetical protein